MVTATLESDSAIERVDLRCEKALKVYFANRLSIKLMVSADNAAVQELAVALSFVMIVRAVICGGLRAIKFRFYRVRFVI